MKNLMICFCYLITCCFLQATEKVTTTFPGAKEKGKFFVYTVSDITGNTQSIKFPKNGDQPDTSTTGEWSGARIDSYNENSPITKWYERMFFEEKMGFDYKNCKKKVDQQKTKKDCLLVLEEFFQNIIKATNLNIRQNTSCIINIPKYLKNTEFELAVRKRFKRMASDPVGRVLLYRILLEIRREKNGCGIEELISKEKIEKDGIVSVIGNTLQHPQTITESYSNYSSKETYRNHLTSIYILPAKNNEMGFSCALKYINFEDNDFGDFILTHTPDGKRISTRKEEGGPIGYSMFHEMLHWYQSLREPLRAHYETHEVSLRFPYQYISSCYMERDLTIWGGIFKDNEMRVILGTPDYRVYSHAKLMKNALLPEYDEAKVEIVKDDHPLKGQFIPIYSLYLEGDDLSENAYRISQAAQTNIRSGRGMKPELCSTITKLRWGHTTYILDCVDTGYLLASKVATRCFNLTMYGKDKSE